MRPSLFDYVIPVAPPPRLQPNIFAKIARYSFNNSIIVILIWAAVSVALFASIVVMQSSRPLFTLEFSGANAAAKNLALLNRNFPNLNALMTITISNDDEEQLKLARLNFMAELENGDDAFAVILAPGSGDYYRDHAVFYYPPNAVQSRVDYALSLKPLFSAIAEQPTTESLATLVSEVSASITLGRDPQGLDELFEQSAEAVQSLMEGNDRHVDWPTVAGLNFEPKSKDVIILALPKLGMNLKANEMARAAMLKVAGVNGTVISIGPTNSPELAAGPKSSRDRLLPYLAMAAIFFCAVLLAIIGRMNLILMIIVPVIIVELFAYAVFNGAFTYQIKSLWPVFLALLVTGLQISQRLSFAVLEATTAAPTKSSACMLAFQKQSAGVVWMAALAVAIWCGWLAVMQANFATLSAIMSAAILINLLAAFTLIPALAGIEKSNLNWLAADWATPIYQALFSNPPWRFIRTSLAWGSLAIAIVGFYMAPTAVTVMKRQINNDQNVNILVQSVEEANGVLQKLSTVDQVQSARWLGAFLPQQADEKHETLKRLENQFPRFKLLSPQEPASLRDQVTSLLVSLEEIATSSAARPDLTSAAHKFRRSLEILANTTSNGEVLEFENRIFGGFSQLAEQADKLANLAVPQLEALDPKLKSLFVSQQDIFRIEVIPNKNISNAALAKLVANQGLAVAHPALQAASESQVLLSSAAIVSGAILLFGLLAMVLAIAEMSGALAGLITVLVGIGGVVAVAEASHTQISQATLLQATALFSVAVVLIASAFLKRQISDYPPPDALHAAEAWMPTMLIAAIAAPAGFLDLMPWGKDLGVFAIALAVITTTTAVLQRPLTLAMRRYGV